MGKSILKNFSYNLALTLSTYVLNLIVFPYVTRVLGAEMYGKFGFIQNIVHYFTLFSLMGVSAVAIRELSACGEDRQKRSAVFSSILSFLFISTLSVLVIYFICIFNISRLYEEINLFLVGSVLFVATSFLIEWLYQGTENFKYITIRTLIIKTLYVVSVFLFIRDESDYRLFFYLTIGMTVVNSIVNLIYSKGLVDFRFCFKHLSLFSSSIFKLGAYAIMVSLYTTFNVIFLGFVCDDSTVGCYYAATRIYGILLGILTAFTTVMLPRMSVLLSEGKEDEYNEKIQASFDLVFAFAIPLVAGGVVLAPQIVRILSGVGYESAVLPMQIIMPLVLICGLAQIWVVQAIMPHKKDGILLFSAIIGAIVSVICNFLLTPKFGAVGSALSMFCSELIVNSFLLVYVLKQKMVLFPFIKFVKQLLLACPYILICIILCHVIKNDLVCLLVAVILCGMYFLLEYSLIVKNSYIHGVFQYCHKNMHLRK